MFRCAVLASLIALFGSDTAVAQLCSGEPTFEGASARLYGSLAFGQAQAFHGGVALGGTRVFGWAEGGLTTYAHDSNLEYGGGLGVQLFRKPETKLQVCPQLLVGLSSGTDDLGVGHQHQTLTFGADVGYVARRGKTNQIVPTATLLYVAGQTKMHYANGVRATRPMESYGLFAAGVGLGLNKQFTLSPSIAVPLGLKGAEPSYTIMCSFKLIGDAN
jgi:hypothetical protein